MDEPCGSGPVHVVARDYSCRSGMDILDPFPQGYAYTREIGLVGVLSKVVDTVIDTRINKAVTFHDIIHGFSAGRVKGTAIVELNSLYMDTIFLVFLILIKLYDNLDEGRLLKTF